MDVADAIRARRSVQDYVPEPVPRETIEALLELATLAPNHRMTEPWAFLVLGDEARAAYARVLGRRKAAKVADTAAADAVRERVLQRTTSVPAILGFAMALADDPEVREEDYAAVFMAIQNVCLGAVARGLGTHIKTGAVMDDAELRDALRVPDDRRLVALLFVGRPAATPEPKPRQPASSRTRWLP